jgi:hypothetical protein
MARFSGECGLPVKKREEFILQNPHDFARIISVDTVVEGVRR